MPRILRSTITADVSYLLTPDQDAVVLKGAIIESTAKTAISVKAAQGVLIDVAGKVVAADDAIQISDTGNGNTVHVAATGRLFSHTNDGVQIGGENALVKNEGEIEGRYGIFLNYTGAGIGRITNSGTISGLEYVIFVNDQNAILRNSGLIHTTAVGGGVASYYGGSLNDQIFNLGKMIGDIYLRGSNDLYDGRAGKVVGVVYGGNQNDLFRPGAFADHLDGGADIDTLSFRFGPAVTVNLLDSTQNTGWALGDTYLGIERIIGSTTGSDHLSVSSENSTIFGLGGADTLLGNVGNDTLCGGAGRDVLSGGLGDDHYVFATLTDFGDEIQLDNMLGNDSLWLNSRGLGLVLPDGPLADSRFHTATTNQAGDADDRFIFETDTTKLWFDRDGSGTRFTPILVANLQAGATLASDDIFLF